MQQAIDISSEMAEGFVLPPFGIPLEDLQGMTISATGETFHRRHLMPRHDDAVVPFISSVSLSCGLHSGDPVLLRRTASKMIAGGIHIGAHPSYPGVFGFGQDRVMLSDEDLEAVLLYQIGAVAAVVQGLGAQLRHVKCHGPLSMDISYDERICNTMLNAVQKFDPGLVIVFMANSPGLAFARARGLRAAAEGYIDRGYASDGRLVPRQHPQALLTDPKQAALRIVEIVCDQQVTCVDGSKTALQADTVCLHSDTPGAAEFAAAVTTALRARGVAVKPLASLLA
jgi:UPF0271 protein